MPAQLDGKLVIAVSANSLFDLSEADRIFREEGVAPYTEYQIEKEDVIVDPGTAFPFIQQLLSVNDGDWAPIEVVVLSRNSPDAGLRVMNSIDHHGLGISRAIFTGGGPRHKYIEPLDARLFLSSNEQAVTESLEAGHPAGLTLESDFDFENEDELRIAFDFDGILADDSAERVYQEEGLDVFHAHEEERAEEPLPAGPLKPLLEKISEIQEEDRERHNGGEEYQPRIRTAVFTSRDAPAHARAVKTLRNWGIEVDEAAFLGGLDKAGFLQAFEPHIFFDDQEDWVESAAETMPSVHVPIGVANEA